jgi:hypothetical protein
MFFICLSFIFFRLRTSGLHLRTTMICCCYRPKNNCPKMTNGYFPKNNCHRKNSTNVNCFRCHNCAKKRTKSYTRKRNSNSASILADNRMTMAKKCLSSKKMSQHCRFPKNG